VIDFEHRIKLNWKIFSGAELVQKVLVVDDEESIRTLVAYNFERAGYHVTTVGDGRTAFDLIRSSEEQFDLVVLDLMLPEMDGMEVCRKLRFDKVDVPIILLTARDDELDLVLGLELGADDYVTKPFSPRELLARARAVLRRFDTNVSESDPKEENQPGQTIRIGDVHIDLLRHEVRVSENLLNLTPKEFDLLEYLMQNQGRVLSRDQLLDHVWGYASNADTRIVDVHMSHLRDKIEADPKNPVYIRTVRGVGYKFLDEKGLKR
jgi:two-component system, OmpR family, alkaline phosphatase synthesis response regulator PhoP